MRSALRNLLLGCVSLVSAAASGPASALLISDIDLSTFSFDITSYSVGSNVGGLGGDATASGTSNGVGWSISPTNLWSGLTRTNGTFDFSALPNNTDNLHPSIGFTLTFAQPVGALLVALSNDNLTDSINFGLTPSDFSGMSFLATQAVLNSAAGGLALFENVNSLTITHVDNNGVSDGFNLAFHVVSVVPVPAAVWLLGAGLVALVGLSRRTTRP
ncbi:MAG: hypothetical protein NFCOHLIN_00243 [Gammaproteobacteria bacterium]|nr:hypothetical protein [Gammaproteobacteria bacterium]